MLARFKLDGFLTALLLVVLAAIVWPEGGVTGGPLRVEWVASYGISIVFFLYGLTLAPERMRQGLAKWRVHIVVQLGTFALFPLAMLACGPLLRPLLPPDAWLGFFYLAALPSTVSSSVAMTSLARGNVPVAIFNATLSAFLGIFVTPILMAWFMETTGVSMPLESVIFKILLLVLLPTVLGQIAHRWLAEWTVRNAGWLKFCDRAVILAIVYNSTSDSIVGGIWSANDPWLVVTMTAISIVFFFVIYELMRVPCKLLGFNREDTIACLFCGSKKSLATGVPLGHVIFGATPALGLILAPLMIFHFFQLVIVSVIANRYAQGAEAEAGASA